MAARRKQAKPRAEPAKDGDAVTKLVLENVRCFVHAEVPLDDKVTVIIGQNGSGKTTIAEALASLVQGQDEGLDAPAAAAPAGASKNAAAAEQCLATANAKRARFSGEPAKVGVRHILVKYKGSKNAAPGITRSREEACLRALEARDKLRDNADFDAVVKEYSEETGAATRSGSLGSVERRELAKPFADAAFELSVNQMSDVVETDFGFHLIYRYE